MKSLLAFISVLSINVASAELVVYEGVAQTVSIGDPLNLIAIETASEFRFRIILDAATIANPPGPPDLYQAPGLSYNNPIRDLSIWVDGVPYPIPTTRGSSLHVTNDYGAPYPEQDGLSVLWVGSKDGVTFRFTLMIEDYGRGSSVLKTEAAMLSSEAIPTSLNLALADTPVVWLDISNDPRWRNVSSISAHPLTSFTITPLSVVNLLQDLRTASEGVGPGKSLANKVILAQTYYAVPDLVSTCAVLADYVTQTAHKKVPAAQGAALAEDARLITSAIACVQ